MVGRHGDPEGLGGGAGAHVHGVPGAAVHGSWADKLGNLSFGCLKHLEVQDFPLGDVRITLLPVLAEDQPYGLGKQFQPSR